MNVINKNAVAFDSLSFGETFSLNNELYMSIFTYHSDEEVCYNAVNLETGALHQVGTNQLVIPVLGYFVLEDFRK